MLICFRGVKMKKISLIFIFLATITLLFGCVGENAVPSQEATLPENSVGDGTDGTQNVSPGDTESSEEEDVSAGEFEQSDKNEVTYLLSVADGLNIRQEPSAQSASLGHIDKGDMVGFYGETEGWYKTFYCGKEAYVKKEYCELFVMEKGDEAVEKVIEVGVKLLGTPYVYGAVRYHDGEGNLLKGFDERRFDCSSFTQYMYYIGAGVCLDLTTRTQILQGTSVDDVQRGDLMFFTNASRKNLTGIERVGHVALYLGDGYILHTASDYAVIEKISATRQSYFISATRYL